MLKPIKNKAQYEASKERVYLLMHMNVKANSRESDELEILSILVKNYEDEAFPMDKPNPIQAIKFRLEQMGLPESYLGRIIGNSRKSEILKGTRKLNLNQIRLINKTLNISADVVVEEY